MKNGTPGSSAERIHAEPTPQPVPISATRVRPRWPASTCSRRPASALHDRVKPARSASCERSLDERRKPRSYTSAVPDQLPLPPHWDPDRVGEVWRVDYAARFEDAERWREQHGSAAGRARTGSASRSSSSTSRTRSARPASSSSSPAARARGALDDSRRLCEFVYRNLGSITQIVPDARHAPGAPDLPSASPRRRARAGIPSRSRLVTRGGRRRRAAGGSTRRPRRGSGSTPTTRRSTCATTPRTLEEGGKYSLTVWPFHAMRGGIGYALVSAVEEALFFHAIARCAPLGLPAEGRQPAHRALLDARARRSRSTARASRSAGGTSRCSRSCSASTRS